MKTSLANSQFFVLFKFLFVFLLWTFSSSLTAAEPIGSFSAPDDAFAMNSLTDGSMENNPKFVGIDNQIYTPNQKNQVDDADVELEKMLRFKEAAENMRRWLILRAQRQLQMQTGKRSGGNYMCHFKLCQGVSAGKRIWAI